MLSLIPVVTVKAVSMFICSSHKDCQAGWVTGGNKMLARFGRPGFNSILQKTSCVTSGNLLLVGEYVQDGLFLSSFPSPKLDKTFRLEKCSLPVRSVSLTISDIQ